MKRVIALLISAAVMIMSVTCMGTAASAAGYTSSLIDQADCFSEGQETALRDLLTQAARLAECNVGVVTADDLHGSSPLDYTEKVLESTFGKDSDSIVLLLNNDFYSEEHYDWIAVSGTAADRYAFEINSIFNEIYDLMDTDGYVGAVIGFCGYFGADGGYITGSASGGTASAYSAVLEDRHGVLSDSEEEYLLECMQSTANEIYCHVGVVIEDDLGGLSDVEYAMQFADDSFGRGSDLVVFLLNNDRSNDRYTDRIYTYGLGTEMFDTRTDAIFDVVYSAMGDYYEDITMYDYYSGIIEFCYALTDISADGDYDYYDEYYDDYDYYFSGSGSVDVVSLLVPFIIAAIITAIAVAVASSGYKKKAPVSARRYLDPDRTRFTDRRDVFLREHTTSVRIDSSSSGGGSRSRGGGGGRSRSGGGGGGGRRR